MTWKIGAPTFRDETQAGEEGLKLLVTGKKKKKAKLQYTQWRLDSEDMGTSVGYAGQGGLPGRGGS